MLRLRPLPNFRDPMDDALAYLDAYPWAATVVGLAALIAAAALAPWVTRFVLFRVLRRALAQAGLSAVGESLRPINVRLARLAPAMVIYQGVLAVPLLATSATTVIRN